jgi:site-specific DNA-methyltransferase (adenine-specific)
MRINENDTGSNPVSSDPEAQLYDGLCDAGLVRELGRADYNVPKPPPADALIERLDQETSEDAFDSSHAGIVSANASEFLFELDDSPSASADSVLFPSPASRRMSNLVDVVCRAFVDVRGQWSSDRVLADPELGDLFLRRCWELGAQASAYELNWTLLHGRKNGMFPDLGRARRFILPRAKLDEFAFASEMAARFVRETHWKRYGREVSLDKILCDPTLSSVFDSMAAQIAPNHSILQYRWAALSLRKSHRSLHSSIRLRANDFEDLGYTRDISLSSVPKSRGIYSFHQGGQMLFCGHTEGLRRQIEIHFDCVGTRVIPSWMREQRTEDARLLIAPVAGLSSSQRELLKANQVAMHHPPYNWVSSLFAA